MEFNPTGTMNTELIVTGATGFTGKFVVQELLSRGIKFDCLVRNPAKAEMLNSQGITTVEADLSNLESLLSVLPKYKKLINVASIGFGAAPIIVKACEESGINRAVFVGTTAIFTSLAAQTKSVRKAAEQAIMSSNLDYTILRPTMIYGTPDDRNMIKLLRLIQKSPIIPVLGSGEALQQPVHVQDVAWAICEVLDRAHTYRREYNIAGGQILTFNEVIQIASKHLGKNPQLLHFPKDLSIQIVKILNTLKINSPITVEQILRLNEPKVFDRSNAKNDFNYEPKTFEHGIREAVKLMIQ
jgi:nucleoside-diphosphate-sugar epimerase